MQPRLSVRNLAATVEGKEVLRGVSLTIQPGEMHVLMGPNGSGKSSLGLTLMGHPSYSVTAGSAQLDGKDLLSLSPDERARAGLFLSFQNPVAIPGVSVANLTRTAAKVQARGAAPDFKTFRVELSKAMASLQLPDAFLDRSVNDGFSGGEKKVSEILQLQMARPGLAILDEPDSGLDIDALKRIAAALQALRDGTRSLLVITHYERILKLLQPDVVHVFVGGRIVASGGKELASELEAKGYAAYVQPNA